MRKVFSVESCRHFLLLTPIINIVCEISSQVHIHVINSHQSDLAPLKVLLTKSNTLLRELANTTAIIFLNTCSEAAFSITFSLASGGFKNFCFVRISSYFPEKA